MMLNDDIELLDGLPVIHIKSIDSLVVSDLHLGYEGVMAKKGVFLPKANFKSIAETLRAALDRTGAKRVIVDGDIKNEFSTVDVEEFNELYDFINLFKDWKAELVLIKGNHDNFVERYKEAFNLQIHRQEASIGGYLFFHGEELPHEYKGAKMLVMGHEHPAIGVFTDGGRKEKLRCFLYGKYKGVPLLVLPAMNYFAAGTEVNYERRQDLLSPVLKEVDVDGMEAIAVGYGATISFGKIGNLRKA